MKKTILTLSTLFIAVFLIGSACNKEAVAANVKYPVEKFPGRLVSDWIRLHNRIIRNTTGVTHVAYTRHFAYTGVALYESLVHGDPHYVTLAAQLNGLGTLPAPELTKHYFWPEAANAAIAEMLRFFYPVNQTNIRRIDSLENSYYQFFNSELKRSEDLENAKQYGKQIAAAVIAWSKTDLADKASLSYTVPRGDGLWEPTPAAFAAPVMPYWGNNRTMVPNSTNASLPAAPLAFSQNAGTPFYNMVKELYDISVNLNQEQTATALYWDDSPNGKFVSAFGHWFSILAQTIDKDELNLMIAAEAYVKLGIAMNDACIGVWKAKYTYNLLRPITYIRKYMNQPGWNSLISTPPHPEYSAAHAGLSGAAGAALENVIGKDHAFTDHTYDDLNMAPRTHSSFSAAADEAGISRLYGGIHYRPSIEAGLAQGRKIAENILNTLHFYNNQQ